MVAVELVASLAYRRSFYSQVSYGRQSLAFRSFPSWPVTPNDCLPGVYEVIRFVYALFRMRVVRLNQVQYVTGFQQLRHDLLINMGCLTLVTVAGLQQARPPVSASFLCLATHFQHFAADRTEHGSDSDGSKLEQACLISDGHHEWGAWLLRRNNAILNVEIPVGKTCVRITNPKA